MRLIDADALIIALHDEGEKQTKWGQLIMMLYSTMVAVINDAPTIDHVRHGKWNHERMLSTSGGTYAVIRCSECMSQYPMWETNYCPNCGAKMDGGEE